jgi:hypothetical protein
MNSRMLPFWTICTKRSAGAEFIAKIYVAIVSPRSCFCLLVCLPGPRLRAAMQWRITTWLLSRELPTSFHHRADRAITHWPFMFPMNGLKVAAKGQLPPPDECYRNVSPMFPALLLGTRVFTLSDSAAAE